jgi:hypothetical protein
LTHRAKISEDRHLPCRNLNQELVMKDKSIDSSDPVEIFQQLKRGLGHERVNDGNVVALIAIAHHEGHALLERELREWRAPSGGETREGPPSTVPPTRGFNKDHVRH